MCCEVSLEDVDASVHLLYVVAKLSNLCLDGFDVGQFGSSLPSRSRILSVTLSQHFTQPLYRSALSST